MSAIEVRHLAQILLESGAVAFSFLNEAVPGERVSVSVRVCDQWDQIDAQVEGNPEVQPGEGFVIGPPRMNQVPIVTSLRYRSESEAGTAILRERQSMLEE